MLIPQNIRRPKTVMIVILVLCGLLLAALNLASWRYLYRIKATLDGEFGQRLQVAVRMAGLRLDTPELHALMADGDGLARLLVRPELTTLQAELDLERIFIVRPDSSIALCIDEKLEGDRLGRYLTAGPLFLPQVAAAGPRVSPLYEITGNYFKAASLPLTDQFANLEGVLVIEANARFLGTIGTFRQGLIAGTIASLAAITFIFVFLASALTALVRLQGALAQSERLALLGGAAAHIAHELRNPLGIIKSTSDLIRRRYQDPAQPDELFSYIDDEVRRLNEMVNHFLLFAREKDLDRKPYRLEDLADEVIASVRPACAEQGITIERTHTPPLPEFSFDRDAVKQVLLNLVCNARDAIAGAGRITIGIETRRLRGVPQAACWVTDTGPGIPADVQPKLFTPFFTTKTTGSGLGLAISQKIAARHHGRLLAGNTPNAGATFTLLLPLRG